MSQRRVREYTNGRQVVTCSPRGGLAALHCVGDGEGEMLDGIGGLNSVNVAHTCNLIAPIAAVHLIRMFGAACARVGVARGIEWARADVVQTRAEVELTRVVKLVERCDEPRSGAVVALVIVVCGGEGEGGFALGTSLAARLATRVLDGEHVDACCETARGERESADFWRGPWQTSGM